MKEEEVKRRLEAELETIYTDIDSRAVNLEIVLTGKLLQLRTLMTRRINHMFFETVVKDHLKGHGVDYSNPVVMNEGAVKFVEIL